MRISIFHGRHYLTGILLRHTSLGSSVLLLTSFERKLLFWMYLRLSEQVVVVFRNTTFPIAYSLLLLLLLLLLLEYSCDFVTISCAKSRVLRFNQCRDDAMLLSIGGWLQWLASVMKEQSIIMCVALVSDDSTPPMRLIVSQGRISFCGTNTMSSLAVYCLRQNLMSACSKRTFTSHQAAVRPRNVRIALHVCTCIPGKDCWVVVSFDSWLCREMVKSSKPVCLSALSVNNSTQNNKGREEQAVRLAL